MARIPKATRSKAVLAAVLLIVAILFAVSANAGAHGALGADEIRDCGRYLISVGGRQLGTEEFTLFDSELRSVVELSVGGGVSRAETVMSFSPENGAELYTLDAGPGGRITVSFAGNVATVSVPGLSREIRVGSPRLILENNFFSHYQLLIAAYDEAAGGVQSFVGLIPGALATATFTVERLGDAPAEGPIPLIAYKVVIDGVIGESVLADTRGRVMRTSIPAQGAEAVREEYKALLESWEKAGAPASDGATVAGLIEQEFTVENGDVLLAAALTIPSDGALAHPLAILISGSGPQDRNGDTPPVYVTGIFREMAERLARAGIAVLRYDERGVGRSTGDFAAAGLTDLVGDVRALVEFAKARPEIDHSRIALVGHSEGGYIAPILTSEDPEIAACVILAGPSVTLDKVMLEQIEFQANYSELDEATRNLSASLIPLVAQFVQDAKDGKSESALPGNLEWLRQHMQLDPIGTIRRVKVPILIVQGDRDLKVMQYHSDALANAAIEAGNPNVTAIRLAYVSHEFLQFPYGNPNFDPMTPMTVVTELYDSVQGWLAQVLK
ncbi:MAG: alpha/beta fold hydrolase [Clostridia bacterium]|nr:alpha/beta fold hydrolase [Clostridia bacterium]